MYWSCCVMNSISFNPLCLKETTYYVWKDFADNKLSTVVSADPAPSLFISENIWEWKNKMQRKKKIGIFLVYLIWFFDKYRVWKLVYSPLFINSCGIIEITGWLPIIHVGDIKARKLLEDALRIPCSKNTCRFFF